MTPITLLWAQTFVLAHPFAYEWSADHPTVRTGTVIVVEVDPDVARPRDVGGAVLYVGTTPAALVDVGWPDGRVVAFVPGTVDLTTTPVYWGSPELPERVGAAHGRQELDLAVANGAHAFPADDVKAATHAGLRAKDETDLYRQLADLVDRYAPSERDRAQSYRVPVTP